jgi:hypothetical protein
MQGGTPRARPPWSEIGTSNRLVGWQSARASERVAGETRREAARRTLVYGLEGLLLLDTVGLHELELPALVGGVPAHRRKPAHLRCDRRREGKAPHGGEPRTEWESRRVLGGWRRAQRVRCGGLEQQKAERLGVVCGGAGAWITAATRWGYLKAERAFTLWAGWARLLIGLSEEGP